MLDIITAQMRCFISYRRFDGLTCSFVTRLAIVHVSVSLVILIGRPLSLHLTLWVRHFPLLPTSLFRTTQLGLDLP